MQVFMLNDEWGEKIREVMESYQIELNNNVYDIKSVKNLGGHNIKYAEIQGGQFYLVLNLIEMIK